MTLVRDRNYGPRCQIILQYSSCVGREKVDLVERWKLAQLLLVKCQSERPASWEMGLGVEVIPEKGLGGSKASGPFILNMKDGFFAYGIPSRKNDYAYCDRFRD